MGKQINFYMSHKVQEVFMEFLTQNNYIFINDRGDSILNPNSNEIHRLFLHKPDYGAVIMRQGDNVGIDAIKSPVIEFNKTLVRNEKKRIRRGRLWISTQYYEENLLVKKKGLFLKDYELLVRWVKKNVPYQEYENGGYVLKEYINSEIIELQEKGYEFKM